MQKETDRQTDTMRTTKWEANKKLSLEGMGVVSVMALKDPNARNLPTAVVFFSPYMLEHKKCLFHRAGEAHVNSVERWYII
jgi:hypothetical protein